MKPFKWKSENFFIVILFVFVTVVIFLLLNFKSDVNNIIGVNSKNITIDAITSVMNATDNAMNKIYNIIVITTVYITVIITTFSLFQYIKSKEIESIKKDLQQDIVALKNMIEKDKTSLDNEVGEKIKEMNLILEKVKKEALNISNLNRIDLLEMKAESEKTKKTWWNDSDAMKAYKEIFYIIDKEPGIIEEKRKSKLYHNYAMLVTREDIVEAEEYYNKAIKYCDKDDTFKAYSYGNLGLIKLNSKCYKKAIELLEKSIDINEVNISNQKLLIEAFDRCNREGDIDRAFSLLKNLRGKDAGEEAEAFFNLINEIKIENVVKKYKIEIDEIKKKYVYNDPGLLSSKMY
ncbi:tetratricopeptide repeat protein [Clostridium sp. CF012]|uniref:tetratricopeptide repeat protein n=1 Tax=Clostridium sp. CF012 TaxID=2843319 RepID=UPI001C0D27F9|nr:tetratricopeptide repeat protein [Clostridium sp. CF012]MBU3142219.1 tetratricopeptide repeat protein [Clostridium sp. CF012]